jgi:hypothetical protein
MMLAITGNSEPHSEERRVRTLAEVEDGTIVLFLFASDIVISRRVSPGLHASSNTLHLASGSSAENLQTNPARDQAH